MRPSLPRMLAILLIAVALIAGCGTSTQPIHTSPNSAVTIREVSNTGGDPYLLAFEIIEQGKPPQRFVTRASTVHSYWFLWNGNDAFTIDSSDIGFLRYERSAHGGWGEGEVMERTSPNGKYLARIYAVSNRKDLHVVVTDQFPAGGFTGDHIKAIDLCATTDDVPSEYFVTRPRRGETYLTSRVLEWDGDDALIVKLKQRTIRIARNSTGLTAD